MWLNTLVVGECTVRIIHSQKCSGNAVSIIAGPNKGLKDFGARISCSLPVTDNSCVKVRPSFSAYWINKSHRKEAKNLLGSVWPVLEVAVVHALRYGDSEDRRIAAIHFITSPQSSEFDIKPDESIQSLVDDECRFRQVVVRWLAHQALSPDRSQLATSAHKIVSECWDRLQLYEAFDPANITSIDDIPQSTLNRCAFFKAIRDAAVKQQGSQLIVRAHNAGCSLRDCKRRIGTGGY